MIEMEMAKAAKRAEEAAAKAKPVGTAKPEEAAPYSRQTKTTEGSMRQRLCSRQMT
jgi:hypothetical protein